jgi:hypothetical protein
MTMSAMQLGLYRVALCVLLLAMLVISNMANSACFSSFTTCCDPCSVTGIASGEKCTPAQYQAELEAALEAACPNC